MRKQLLVWALAGLIAAGPILIPIPALAGGPFATEFTQLLNYATLIHQYAQQIQMVSNTFRQYQQMLYNSRNLTKFPLTSVTTDLTKLFNISQGSFGVAYSMSQLDQQFGKIYQSYSSTANGTPYYKAYGSWRSGTLSAIQNAIAAAGMQPQMINNEQSVIGMIKNLMQTPQGQEQSVQLGYTISLEMNNQLEKLRTLMASDLQSKAAFSAYQVQKDAANAEMVQNVLQHSDYGANHTRY